MRVIIAGSRRIRDRPTLDRVMAWAEQMAGIVPTEVVSGHCPKGVDKLGEEWAKDNDIPVMLFPADWNKNPYDGGFIRNCQMRAYADALVAVWDGCSNGTRHMIEQMQVYNKPFFVFNTHMNECYHGNSREQGKEKGTQVSYGTKET